MKKYCLSPAKAQSVLRMFQVLVISVLLAGTFHYSSAAGFYTASGTPAYLSPEFAGNEGIWPLVAKYGEISCIQADYTLNWAAITSPGHENRAYIVTEKAKTATVDMAGMAGSDVLLSSAGDNAGLAGSVADASSADLACNEDFSETAPSSSEVGPDAAGAGTETDTTAVDLIPVEDVKEPSSTPTVNNRDLAATEININSAGLGWAVSPPEGVPSNQEVLACSDPGATSVWGGGTICNGSSLTLYASCTDATTIYWQAGSCPSGFTGTTGSSVTFYPSSTTTYYARGYSCSGWSASCGSATITVNSNSVAPTGISIASNGTCVGATKTLTVSGGSLGTGASWQWYTGGCGTTYLGSGSSISVNPSSNTTYYVLASGTCNTTACASATVSVATASVAPTGISIASNGTCVGTSKTLTVSGGSLGTGAVWQWFTGGCGTTSVGTGTSISVNPASNTTYYVRASGTCNTTGCASNTVSVSTAPGTPTSPSGSGTGTTTATISWAANGGSPSPTYYWSVYAVGSGNAYITGSSTTGTSVGVTGLLCGITYYFTVYASNTCGSSGTAQSGNFSTSACSEYVVPHNGSGSITTCSGNLYDPGGSANNYYNYANGYMIIYPSGSGNQVQLTGSYVTESCCDPISIYDGAGIGGTLLGTYQGTGSIPTITSSGPGVALTVKFTSDVSVTPSGFNFTIGCVCVTPGAVSVATSGTYCNSTTLNASGGANGTIYYQGTTSGGMSTSNPTTSVSVSSSGTYYFRARSACGTWGAEGSATVTIVGTSALGTWEGKVSTDWFDVKNWGACTVPTAAINVTIPSGTPYSPIIAGAAVCNNITINSGASLTISGSNTLNVSGNWTNNGTFTPGTGRITFNGSSNSTIGGSALTTFYELFVSKNSSAYTVIPSINVSTTYLRVTAGTYKDGGMTTSITCPNGIAWSLVTGANAILTVDGGGTVTASDYHRADVNGGGTVNVSSGTFHIGHCFFIDNGNINISGGTLEVAKEFYAANTGIKMTMSGGLLRVGGDFLTSYNAVSTWNVTGGTTEWYDSGNGYTPNFTTNSSVYFWNVLLNRSITQNRDISVAGNWTNNSTYTHGSYTVTFNGTGSITGNTDFYNVNVTSGTRTQAAGIVAALGTGGLNISSGAIYNKQANTLKLGTGASGIAGNCLANGTFITTGGSVTRGGAGNNYNFSVGGSGKIQAANSTFEYMTSIDLSAAASPFNNASSDFDGCTFNNWSGSQGLYFNNTTAISGSSMNFNGSGTNIARVTSASGAGVIAVTGGSGTLWGEQYDGEFEGCTYNYITWPNSFPLTVAGAQSGASHANGTYYYYSGTSVTVSAGTYSGYCCTGWTGTGSVPASGTGSTCTFTITGNSTITWQWGAVSVAPTSISFPVPGQGQTICVGGTTTMSQVGGTLGTNAVWAWYSGSCGGTYEGGTNTAILSPSATTTYYVRAEGGCGATACASTTVNVVPDPSVGAASASNANICVGGSSTLSASVSGGTGLSYQWEYSPNNSTWNNVANGTPTGASYSNVNTTSMGVSSITSAGVYYYRLVATTSISGCSSPVAGTAAMLSLNPNSVAPTSISPASATICSGGSQVLDAIGGMVAYYPFSSNLNDASGNNLNLSGTGYFANGGLTLNGNTFTSPMTTVLNTDKHTISFDVQYLATPTTWNKIFGYTPSGDDRSPGIWTSQLQPGLHWRYNPSNSGIDESMPVLNQWYHVVGIKDGATFKIYVDGTLKQNIAVSNPKTAGGATLNFGNGSNVVIKEFKIYNGVLNWYTASCGGTLAGSGPSITVSPGSSTTYYLRSEGACNNTSCVSATVTVLNAMNYGTVASGDQTICNGATPSSMSVSGATGSTSFTYQWYSQAGIVTCPSGSSTSGWTSLGSTNGANTATYTPASGITASTTYACFVTPGGSPTCGTATWASGCRKVTVLNAMNYGTVASGDQT
ncbi:MAG TPA: hypothetical protein PKN48_08845, partial [Bacteroidales bacterium]|nr:hypothetical protein [Bacteroidales bacterium]